MPMGVFPGDILWYSPGMCTKEDDHCELGAMLRAAANSGRLPQTVLCHVGAIARQRWTDDEPHPPPNVHHRPASLHVAPSSCPAMSTQIITNFSSSSAMPDATFDDLSADIAQRLLPPQDLLPHAPLTSRADNLAIAPWTAPDEDEQAVSALAAWMHDTEPTTDILSAITASQASRLWYPPEALLCLLLHLQATQYFYPQPISPPLRDPQSQQLLHLCRPAVLGPRTAQV